MYYWRAMQSQESCAGRHLWFPCIDFRSDGVVRFIRAARASQALSPGLASSQRGAADKLNGCVPVAKAAAKQL